MFPYMRLPLLMMLLVYYLQLDSKHEAANAYVDAANCYKKTSNKGEHSVE